MWLARTCSGVEVLLDVLLVVALDVTRGHDDLGLHRVGVHEQVLDPALLGDAVPILVLVEVRAQLGVGDLHLVLHLVGREDDQLQLDLLVALAVLAFDIRVRHRDPVGHCSAQLLGQEGASQVVLELLGRERRALHPQHPLVHLLAGELPVLLERGNRHDAMGDLRIAHR